MAQNYSAIKGTPRAIGEQVLVTEMHFGEQTTAAGLIISSDDGDTRGIYPRWGKVYSKGPDNKDDYEVGDWILVSHGRWTRGLKLETEADGEIEIRKAELESILAYSKEKPNGIHIGAEFTDGTPATIDPSSFITGA
jgi:hypothetical protein|tara:strand:+ start:8621 stop:9031 length:411 start_codon:yes stop_codon:yes gene_type:complete